VIGRYGLNGNASHYNGSDYGDRYGGSNCSSCEFGYGGWLCLDSTLCSGLKSVR